MNEYVPSAVGVVARRYVSPPIQVIVMLPIRTPAGSRISTVTDATPPGSVTRASIDVVQQVLDVQRPLAGADGPAVDQGGCALAAGQVAQHPLGAAERDFGVLAADGVVL